MGAPVNLDAIKAIRTAIKIPIEVGGGIRGDTTQSHVWSPFGINRIILGTSAIENPTFVQEACAKFPGKIIVGIDAKDGMVAIRGWAEVTKVRAIDLAIQMQDYGVISIIYTDIKRDGMLSGPNIEATKMLADALHIPVIASGGVHTMKDIENLLTVRYSGVSGVITGKAIYSGSLNLKEAITFIKMNDNRCVR